MTMPLPEQPHPAGQRQPLDGWPVVEPAAIAKRDEMGPMVYAAGRDPGFVLVPRDSLPPDFFTPTRPPAPVHDPWPKRIVATGAAAPFVGWGAALLVNALAGATTALGLLVAALLLARMTGGRRGGDTYNVTVKQKWFGRATHNG